MKNTFKVKPENEKKGGAFGWMEGSKPFTGLFENGLPIEIMPRVVFITLLGIFYIGNTHYAERTIREIDKLEKQVEDLRADFTTLKADYMFSSKQSEVARRIAPRGLEESKKPPIKIRLAEE